MFPTSGTRLSRRPPRYVGANLTTNSVTVANQVMIGNSSVNTTSNSTHFFSGNATVFGFSNSTAEGIANSTANSITTPAFILFQSNTTSNSILSNSSLIFNSNSTINVAINTTSIAVGVVGATSGALLTNNNLIIGNSTVNTSSNSSHFFAGNSTVYGFSNSTAEGIVNSTANSIMTPASITFNANTTQNSTTNSTTYSFNYAGASVVRPYTSILVATNGLAANSNTTVQAVFPTGQKTITLPATTTFLIDAMYIITNASSTGVGAGTQLQTSFGNSAAIGAISYSGVGATINSTSATAFSSMGFQASSNAATPVSPSMGVTANVSVVLKGAITTVGAVQITPQVSFVAATNSTPQVMTGSYITFTPVSNTTAGTCNLYGTWA